MMWTPGDRETVQLRPGEIHIWRAPLRAESQFISAMAATLSLREQERVAPYLQRDDRERRIVKWGILRGLLADYLNTLPQDIEIDWTAKGRPYLASGATIEFSLSSSTDTAVYAFGERRALGIDVERVRHLPDYDDIVNNFFAPFEKSQFAGLDEANRKRKFFRFWVRKEALLKAAGEGLNKPLDYFELSDSPDTGPKVVRVGQAPGKASDWWLQDFSLGHDLPAALAATAEPKAVRYYAYTA